MPSDPAEAIIVGGGLAGSTLAALLAEAGRSVQLLEKTSAPHDKMCGDFLSQEAIHYLSRSGIDAEALGAVPITAVRLVRRDILAEAALPFRALSLRRRILDEALLQHAARAGAKIHRGVRVQSIAHEGSRHTVQLDAGRTLSAPTLFLATGKHDLQGHFRKGGWQNDLVAFKMYFRLTPEQQASLTQHIELLLFPGGYAGLQPVDGGLANLCLLVTRRELHRCDSKWTRLLDHICRHSPHLARRLSGASSALDRPLALSSIPYGFLAPTPASGLWPLGDQSAVIPSFSGDGMSIALHSAHLAAAMYLNGEPPAAFTARMRRELRPGVTLATGLSHLLVRVPAAAAITRWRPSLLRRVATATRIPARCLLR
jgi:flavin-dependent dehydrogenase